MLRFVYFILGLASVILVSSCDLVDPAIHEEQIVVESYQVANYQLQPVRLTRTAALNADYDPLELAVSDAVVQIHLLGTDGSIEKSYRLREQSHEKGFYVPTTTDRVLPARTYELDVTLPDQNTRITSRTIVPDTFRIVNTNADTVTYQGSRQLEVTVTRSNYPNRQTVFIFTTEALEPHPTRLTPLARHLFEEEEVSIEELRTSSAPPLNESNYIQNSDGTLTLRMPWLMISFYGPQRVTANAIDDNMYDFLRSWQIQQGGSTLSPGEIPNVIDHVDGGTGIFGSYATVFYDFFVRNPND